MSDKIVDKKGNMIRYQTTAEAVREERQRIVGIINKCSNAERSQWLCNPKYLLKEIESKK